MAVDLTDRAPFPQREGPLWEALLAALSVAGVFPPQERNGHRLVDGIALVPVPTASVLEDGADVVVSVNLMSAETLERWPEAARARGRARQEEGACSTRCSRSWTSASSTRASGTPRWPTSRHAALRARRLARLPPGRPLPRRRAGRPRSSSSRAASAQQPGGPGPCTARDGAGSIRLAHGRQRQRHTGEGLRHHRARRDRRARRPARSTSSASGTACRAGRPTSRWSDWRRAREAAAAATDHLAPVLVTFLKDVDALREALEGSARALGPAARLPDARAWSAR